MSVKINNNQSISRGEYLYATTYCGCLPCITQANHKVITFRRFQLRKYQEFFRAVLRKTVDYMGLFHSRFPWPAAQPFGSFLFGKIAVGVGSANLNSESHQASSRL